MAKEDSESPTQTDSLMEEVCQRDNLWKALKRVQANTVDIDLEKFFDRVNHDMLLGRVPSPTSGVRRGRGTQALAFPATDAGRPAAVSWVAHAVRKVPDLTVIGVAGETDHVQIAPDHPHIRA